MPSVEERLAYLEGRVGDQTDAIVDIRTDIRGLRGEMNGLRGDLQSLRGEMNGGFAALRSEMNARFAGVDAKMTWLIGIQVGMLLMIASAALGYFFK